MSEGKLRYLPFVHICFGLHSTLKLHPLEVSHNTHESSPCATLYPGGSVEVANINEGGLHVEVSSPPNPVERKPGEVHLGIVKATSAFIRSAGMSRAAACINAEACMQNMLADMSCGRMPAHLHAGKACILRSTVDGHEQRKREGGGGGSGKCTSHLEPTRPPRCSSSHLALHLLAAA